MKNKRSPEKPFIALENVTIRIQDRFVFQNTSWEIKTNQHWAILGPNGAGKTLLARALTGEFPVIQGTITRHYTASHPDSIGYVSFELHQHLIAQEHERDESRFFSGKLDSITTARQTILSANPTRNTGNGDFQRISEQLEIGHLLDRGIRFLSTGEMRKVLIARSMLNSPKLLILDDPFGGLDVQSRNKLADSINALMNRQMQVILVTHRFEEITPRISHVLYVKDCMVSAQGRREDILKTDHIKDPDDRKRVVVFPEPQENEAQAQGQDQKDRVLVSMKDTTVTYGKVVALKNLNWTMKKGENWAIVGPNGAGKTTLLSLITGDNPQAYSNELYLFGKRRGSGESIWDIKRRIGVISSVFHIHY